MAQNIGKIVQVIGPVLDVEFAPDLLPELYSALRVEEGDVRLVSEVHQHIGRNQVRAVAMASTDGVVRGMAAVDTGGPITVPVGKTALGRILNVLGEPVDGGAPIPADAERWPIHRPAPKFTDLEPKTEIFETGVTVDSKGDVAVLASTGAPKVVVAKLDGATGAAAWPAPVPLADMEITADLLLVAAEASADFVVAGRNAMVPGCGTPSQRFHARAVTPALACSPGLTYSHFRSG